MTARSSLRTGILALATCAALLGARAAGAQALERAPYLQMLGPNAVTITWATLLPEDSVVHYGASPLTLDQSSTDLRPDTRHEMRLAGLAPATRYYYSVGSSSARHAGGDAAHYFVTAPPAGAPAKFRAWIVGDSGTGGADAFRVRDAMLAATRLSPPNLFLHMGDMAYSTGRGEDFTTKFFAVYADILSHTVVWPTMGNHEGYSSSSLLQTGPYYEAYVLPQAGEVGGLPSGSEAYYSFDHANVHFVVLDSYGTPRGESDAMLTWMKADLAATAQDWIVAYFHHPPYTKGTHDSDIEVEHIEMRENAVRLLEAAGVDLVLGGHSHVYERSYLVDGAYDTPTTATGHVLGTGSGDPVTDGPYTKRAGINPREGAVYVVAGHGGAHLGVSGAHPLMLRTEAKFGSCILDVQGNRLALWNVRADETVSDRFTLLKGRGVVVAAPDGGETLLSGVPTEIRWVTIGSAPLVDLFYSPDGGTSWTSIATLEPNQGSYTWTPPPRASEQALIRVSSSFSSVMADESNGKFTVTTRVEPDFTVVPLGAEWRYYDAPAPFPPSSWTALDFDDSTWAYGAAQLGYGDGDEATLLSDADPNAPSAFFRRTFELDDPVLSATLRVLHDDGAIVWINGTRVLSRYADLGESPEAFASTVSQDNQITTAPLGLAPNPFVEGRNVLAVMVKQESATSSDLSFDLELSVALAKEPDGGVPAPDSGTPPTDGGPGAGPAKDASVETGTRGSGGAPEHGGGGTSPSGGSPDPASGGASAGGGEVPSAPGGSGGRSGTGGGAAASSSGSPTDEPAQKPDVGTVVPAGGASCGCRIGGPDGDSRRAWAPHSLALLASVLGSARRRSKVGGRDCQ